MKLKCFIFVAVIASAQEPQFRIRAREVAVPVAVMTNVNKPVESLGASDFMVLNDGKPQAVRLVERDTYALPVHAVIVVQNNGGAEAALAKIRKTASVVSSYITNDMEMGAPSLAAVVTVADEVHVAQNFTADSNSLEEAFKKLSAIGDAGRLLDGASLACDMLAARKETARRVIVLIGESRDRGSKTRFADVVAKAQRNDIAIYTLSYSAYTTAFTQKASERQPEADQPGLYDPNAQGGANLLAIGLELARLAKINIADALAQATGGAHDKFTTLHCLEKQLTAVGTELHNRYLLTFVPPEPQPVGYHRLSVSIRNSGDWRIHARPGYWTAAE